MLKPRKTLACSSDHKFACVLQVAVKLWRGLSINSQMVLQDLLWSCQLVALSGRIRIVHKPPRRETIISDATEIPQGLYFRLRNKLPWFNMYGILCFGWVKFRIHPSLWLLKKQSSNPVMFLCFFPCLFFSLQHILICLKGWGGCRSPHVLCFMLFWARLRKSCDLSFCQH